MTLPLSRRPVAALAIAAGVAVANVYYAHPMLDAISAGVGLGAAAAGTVVTTTQVGYALGLIVLVPLGDLVDRRRLIVTQLAVSGAALVAVASARSAAVLLAGMVAVGALAVVTQSLVTYAAALAGPHERGAVVGTVTGGVVVGIVMARAFAGVVTQLAGWRAVYVASAALTLAVAGLLTRALPRSPTPPGPVRYGRLLASTLALYRTHRILRVRAVLAMFIFAALNIVWAPLALLLSAPPVSLPHNVIGLFGLAGLTGILAAGRAGRLADRGRERATTGVALALLLAAWVPLSLARHSLALLAAGLALAELAVQAVHVANQSVIYRIDPAARGRLAAAYMVFYSIGSALGSIASTVVYSRAGWAGVCVLGAAVAAAALAWWAATAIPTRPQRRVPPRDRSEPGSTSRSSSDEPRF